MTSSIPKEGFPLFLSEAQLEVLSALCETFIPSLSNEATEKMVQDFAESPEHAVELRAFAKRSGKDNDFPRLLAEFMQERLPVKELQQISLALTVLGTSPGTYLMSGRHWAPFTSLSVADREKVVLEWGSSRIGQKRDLHSGIKGLCFQLYYSYLSAQSNHQTNPNWKAIQYPGPDPERNGEKFKQSQESYVDLKMLQIDHDNTVLEFDAVVIGSGCGGGVMAAELSQAGFSVLVVDKGPYVPPSQLALTEYEAYNTMFEQKAVLPTKTPGAFLLAGSCFGGGSSVNWACSLRTPHHVREEWATKYGLTHFTSPAFARSLDTVCARVNVTEGKDVTHDQQNSKMLIGAKKLGLAAKVAGQNIKKGAKHECGWCGFGCRYGEKQGS